MRYLMPAETTFDCEKERKRLKLHAIFMAGLSNTPTESSVQTKIRTTKRGSYIFQFSDN